MLTSYPFGARTCTALGLFSGFAIEQQDKHTKQILRKFFVHYVSTMMKCTHSVRVQGFLGLLSM